MTGYMCLPTRILPSRRCDNRIIKTLFWKHLLFYHFFFHNITDLSYSLTKKSACNGGVHLVNCLFLSLVSGQRMTDANLATPATTKSKGQGIFLILWNHFNLWGSIFEVRQRFCCSWRRNFVGSFIKYELHACIIIRSWGCKSWVWITHESQKIDDSTVNFIMLLNYRSF